MSLYIFYRKPALSAAKKNELLSIAQKVFRLIYVDIETEYCFNIETKPVLPMRNSAVLRWLLAETFEPEIFLKRVF